MERGGRTYPVSFKLFRAHAPAPKTSAPVRTAASLHSLPIQAMKGFRKGLRDRDNYKK